MSDIKPNAEVRAKKGSLKGLICTVEKCDQPMKSKGMCTRHYKQANRTGKATPGLVGAHGPLNERFWHFVEKGPADECWCWQGQLDKDGYGKISDGERPVGAHRVSFKMHNPDISIDGLMVRHKCNNPPCVNPAHLLPGTNLDNMVDRLVAGHYATNEAHSNTKFSNEVVAAVRAATGTHDEVARRFGMSTSQAGNIRRGQQRPEVAA